MRRAGALLAAPLLALLTAACSGPSPGDAEPEGPVTCEVRFAAPSGYSPLEPFEERYPDHIGVRLGFRGPERREFHVFAGIPGEFGEGLPAAGQIAMSEGRTAELVGRGEIWVATWTEGGRCDPRAVLGTGQSRRGFLDAMREAGLLAPR